MTVLTERRLVACGAGPAIVRRHAPVGGSREARRVGQGLTYGVTAVTVTLEMTERAFVGFVLGHTFVVAWPTPVMEPRLALLAVRQMAGDAVLGEIDAVVALEACGHRRQEERRRISGHGLTSSSLRRVALLAGRPEVTGRTSLRGMYFMAEEDVILRIRNMVDGEAQFRRESKAALVHGNKHTAGEQDQSPQPKQSVTSAC